ncbi:MAG: hypothetical protein WBD71_06470 [Xanthobacteraceae bacterium]
MKAYLIVMTQRSSQAAVNRPGSHDPGPFGQVLPFRRQGTPGPIRLPEGFRPDAGLAAEAAELDDDFASYERERENDDPEEQEEVVDYRQRMLMNFVALAVVTFLMSSGVWLADTIGGMQRDQDCIIQGRANCAPIELPNPVQP